MSSKHTKKLCFRFDVDTHKCAKTGMPRLLDLAKEKGVKFTFFINCGRAIDIQESLKALIKRKSPSHAPDYPQLGARRKLGNVEYLRCAILNPRIIDVAAEVIQRAHREGHEIGLHGGRNHEQWGRHASEWPISKIKDELQWGLDQLKGLGIVPSVFASPCATGGGNVPAAVSSFSNFEFISDILNPEANVNRLAKTRLPDVPTVVCGAGGVAFIEQQVALGLDRQQIVKAFGTRIARESAAVFYDHPYFAGDEAIETMSALVDCAIEAGFEITSLSEIGRELQRA